jgi:methylenetetrahydrofolate reductase (NADPH)
MPPKLRSILDKFGERPGALRQAGIAYATEQIVDLVANGCQGIHIYTMNRPEIAAEIFKNLSFIRKTKI